MWIKVCGLKDPENIREVAALEPQALGFIFSPSSPRYAGELPPQVVRNLPPGTRRVGVFVDAPCEEVFETVRRYALDTVQLHGEESPGVCAALRGAGLRVIKACGVATREDLSAAAVYREVCDALLFDTKSPLRGGTGQRFDWEILAEYRGTLPFLLAGGIGPGDAPRLARVAGHPACLGVDLNSRFETAPGIKDVAALREFMAVLREKAGDRPAFREEEKPE